VVRQPRQPRRPHDRRGHGRPTTQVVAGLAGAEGHGTATLIAAVAGTLVLVAVTGHGRGHGRAPRGQVLESWGGVPSAGTVLRHADQAMYHAKRAGGRIHLYDLAETTSFDDAEVTAPR
jgi:hypothetical protein